MTTSNPLERLLISKQELKLRKSILEMLHKSEPNMPESDESFKTAVVVLWVSNVGASDIEKLIRLSTYDHGFVTKTLQNMANCGLWKHGRICHSGWFDKKTGGLSFWLDIACVCGLLERSPANRHHCRHCGHDWTQRASKSPKVCPKCKSTAWANFDKENQA